MRGILFSLCFTSTEIQPLCEKFSVNFPHNEIMHNIEVVVFVQEKLDYRVNV